MRAGCETRELRLHGLPTRKMRTMMRARFDTRELRYTRATIARPPPLNMRAMIHTNNDVRKPTLPAPPLPPPNTRAMIYARYDAREL